MSSLSFIAQSQQQQRYQQVNSPTNAILQAGSDCGCNHSNLSMIAQSQKTGCGCNDGGNDRKRVIEQQDQYSMARPDCYLVFSHYETIEVEDTPLQDNPDIEIAVYKRVCYNTPGGGGGSGKGGAGFFTQTPNTILSGLDLIEDPVERRVCVSCELINKLLNTIAKSYKEDNLYPNLTDEERRLFNALYGLLREAFKVSIERAFAGDFDPNLRNQKGETDEVILEEMEVVYNRLKLHGNVMDPASNVMSERGEMFEYIIEYLNVLSTCPDAVFIKLQRFPSVTFKFESVDFNDETIYAQDPVVTVREFTPNGQIRQFYSSHLGFAKNPKWDKECGNGYSITRFENGLYGYHWSKLVNDMIL